MQYLPVETYVVLDDEDLKRVSEYRWKIRSIGRKPYVFKGPEDVNMLPLANFILNVPNTVRVVLKNTDWHDYRKENLQVMP